MMYFFSANDLKQSWNVCENAVIFPDLCLNKIKACLTMISALAGPDFPSVQSKIESSNSKTYPSAQNFKNGDVLT